MSLPCCMQHGSFSSPRGQLVNHALKVTTLYGLHQPRADKLAVASGCQACNLNLKEQERRLRRKKALPASFMKKEAHWPTKARSRVSHSPGKQKIRLHSYIHCQRNQWTRAAELNLKRPATWTNFLYQENTAVRPLPTSVEEKESPTWA